MESQKNQQLARAFRRYGFSVRVILMICPVLIFSNIGDNLSRQQASIVNNLHGDLGVILAQSHQAFEALDASQDHQEELDALPALIASKADLEKIEQRYEEFARLKASQGELKSERIWTEFYRKLANEFGVSITYRNRFKRRNLEQSLIVN